MPVPAAPLSQTIPRNRRRLVVQIPCLNEAATLPVTLATIPRRIQGIDEVLILVVDDGSTDGTAEVARRHGADHVVHHHAVKGLAAAFRTGLVAALALGADIIVNTDGDNQYHGGDIPALVGPILCGDADIVVGDRCTAGVSHFSGGKKLLQALGSRFVALMCGMPVPDAVSGFRAIERGAAARLTITSRFSYTIEMLVQARGKGMAVAFVPVRVNPPVRPSRLSPNPLHFVVHSATTAVTSCAIHRPLWTITVTTLAAGLLAALIAIPTVG